MDRLRARRTAAVLLVASVAVSACTSTGEPSSAPSSAAPSGTSASPSVTTSSTAASPSPRATVEPASCPKGFSRAALRACVQRAVAVYVAAWRRDLDARGVTGITAPRIRIFDSPPANPCIDLSETDAVAASFWCWKNATVYVSADAARSWTRQYATAAKARGVLAGDAATAGTTTAALLAGYPLVGTTTELAHELGHWVQDVSGQRTWFESRSASSDFAVSNRATVVAELAADCMAGWVQGRTAADGTWVDTRIGAWAHHATMAELGGDLDAVGAGFRFPPEKAKEIIGYGSAYSRLTLYDLGHAAGRAGRPGLATCTSTVVGLVGGPAPPSP